MGLCGAELTYQDDQEINIQHGSPILNFYLKDEQGTRGGDIHIDIGLTSKIKKGSTFLARFSPTTISNFNESLPAPLTNASPKLKPGSYTVGVTAQFSVNGEELNIPVETQITIN